MAPDRHPLWLPLHSAAAAKPPGERTTPREFPFPSHGGWKKRHDLGNSLFVEVAAGRNPARTECLSSKSSDEQACFTNRGVALQTPHRSVYPGSTVEGCVGGTGPQSKGHSLESAFQLAPDRRPWLHNDAQSVRQRRALCCQPRDHPTTADTEPYSGTVRSRTDIPQLPRLEALTAEPRPIRA